MQLRTGRQIHSIFRTIITIIFLCFTLACTRSKSPLPAQVRVISLAPNITEIICAIGGADMLVGRTTACDFPPEIASVPYIGGFGAPSLELLLAANPTLILDADLEDETIAEKIRNLGLRRERVQCVSLNDIPNAIVQIGTLIHLEKNANKIATDLAENIADLRNTAAIETNRPSVYVEIWHDPTTTIGTNTFLSEIIYLAGGGNIGDQSKIPYFQVSPEWIVSQNPDIILCLYMAEGNKARDSVLKRPGWQSVKAIRTAKVYDGLDNNILLRPGPRVLDGIATIRQCILESKQ
ncbi:MAG: cobalamin-binding protein [Lentisphaerae bacterium]|nr:cobalamin-binding protein [Lentisphaerota bacterium]